ncbi:MAG: PorV/PorQ family protein [bacterium]|nr:PorV/PorQ family protein [bacterium]
MDKIWFIAGILLWGSFAFADKPGSTGSQFLKIGVGARPVAMGEAFCGLADDINALYWNPAGLTQLSKIESSLMHAEWLEGMRYEFVGYSQPLNDDVIGCSLVYFDYGDLIGRDINDTPTGNFGAYNLIGSLAYGMDYSPSLSLGINTKLIFQKHENEDALGICLDTGMLYKMKALSFGAVLQNLGPKMRFVSKGFSLPLTLKIGAAYKLPVDGLVMVLDMNKVIDNNSQVNAGVEWTIRGFAIRCGINSTKELNKGICGGVGFKLGDYDIDYAYVPFGDICNTHRVSLSLKSDVSIEHLIGGK